MEYLAANNFDQCFKLLKNSERILNNEDQQLPQDIKNSLDLEMSDPNTEKLNIAGTHLNLCAIYSQLGKHLSAIQQAKLAIAIIEQLITVHEQDKQEKVKTEQQKELDVNQDEESKKQVQFEPIINDKQTEQKPIQVVQQQQQQDQQIPLVTPDSSKEQKNLYLTEAIAYYNLGAAYEHLKRFEEALRSFQIALEIGKIHLGLHHPLTIQIQDNFLKAQEKNKYHQTSHMLRDYLRKEKATSKIFNNHNFQINIRRNSRQQNTRKPLSPNRDIQQ